MRHRSRPLILAGMEYLLPLYRETSSYPYLLEKSISGNPDEMGETELHKIGWDLVAPHLKKAQEEAAAKYRDLVGTGKTSNDLKEIILSAGYGRVDVLFIAKGIQQWGHFDPEEGAMAIHLADYFQYILRILDLQYLELLVHKDRNDS